MDDQETFAQHVASALSHLHDRPYLQGHPLARLLAGARDTAPAEALRRELLDAIEQLRPDAAAPPASPTWRRHRHLVLRYVEGASLEATARELLVSVRQAHRDHAEALEYLTAALWQRHQRLRLAAADRPGARPPAESPLEAELLRVATGLPEEPTDVAAVVRGVLPTIARLAEGHGVALAVSLPDPPPTVGVKPIALRQMLLNLLTFAIERHRATAIDLQAAERQGQVQLRALVRCGAARPGPARVGAEPPEADDLLAIARRLAEIQGGALQLRPAGEGELAIELTLPAMRLSTVLLIDDNPDLARLFRRYLRSSGYRLVQATNAERAVRLAGEIQPDAIILDVLMPTLDGWQVLQQIRARAGTAATPVIVCSVLPERALAESLGVVEFLAKPVAEPDLIAALARCRQAAPGH